MAIVVVIPSDFLWFEPHFLRAYGRSVREKDEHGTAVARPLVLINATVGTVPMLRRTWPSQIECGLCCHADFLPIHDWSRFNCLSGQGLQLTFYNPNETAVHGKIEMLGKGEDERVGAKPKPMPKVRPGISRQTLQQPPDLTWIGVNSLEQFPDGVPPGQEFIAKVDAGDACGLKPRTIVAKSYEYAYPRQKLPLVAEVFPQEDHPVILTKGWAGNRPLIEDQERKSSMAVTYTGKSSTVDWPSFTSVQGQGLDLRLTHNEDKNMHIFVNLHCEFVC